MSIWTPTLGDPRNDAPEGRTCACDSCGKPMDWGESIDTDGWGVICEDCAEGCDICRRLFPRDLLVALDDCVACEDCAEQQEGRA